ncbi:MAG: DUF4340 domain-containing protein [Planctomycetota bacterium]
MNRRNGVLLIVFLVLFGLALALEQPWRGDAFARTRARIVRLFPRLEAERGRISEVVIHSGAKTATLVRGADGWKVRERFGHPADFPKVVRLVDAMTRLDTRETVSDNPERREVYKVDEAEGTAVTVFDDRGAAIAGLITGGLRGQDVRQGAKLVLQFYVRRQGTDEVILADRFTPPSADPADWLAGPFLPRDLEASAIDWIEREDKDGGHSWRIERVVSGTGETKTSAWRLTAPREAPAWKEAGDHLVKSLLALWAKDVAAPLSKDAVPGPEYGFDTNVLRAEAGERRFEIHLGRSAGPEARYAWIPGLPFVYTLDEYRLEPLLLSVEALLPPEKGENGGF